MGDSSEFSVHFPVGKLVVAAQSPESQADWAGAVLTTNGQIVAKLIADDGEEDYKLLKAIYDDAFRSLTRWDEAVQQIEDALKSDEAIGLTEDDGDDKIPF